MKPMTLRMRIFLPMMVIMLIFPIVTYFTFITLSNAYTRDIAESEIASTLVRIKEVLQTIETAPGEINPNESEEDAAKRQAQTFMNNARRELRVKRFDAQIIILNNTRTRVLYPMDVSGEHAAIVEHYQRLFEADPDTDTADAFENIWFEEQAYRACMVAFHDPGGLRRNYVIVFSPVIESASFVQAFGIQVFVITTVLAFLALFVSWMVSGQVYRPISRLCAQMRRIGSGDFTSVEITSDIAEIRELERATGDMSARLKRSDTAQKAFFQNASHELRTPLMSIRGYAEGLKLGVLGDTREAAAIIADESVRLTDLVDELLQLSRLDNDQLALDLQPIALFDFVAGYARRLDGVAMQNGVQVQIDPPDTPVRVMADETLLAKAVSNVLSNALRYAKSRVTVHMASDGATAIVWFDDDGPGVDPAVRERLFERFSKGENGHFGIGLAVAKSALHYMGGAIRLEPSQIGASFALTLPAA